jgi:hypothetical protein
MGYLDVYGGEESMVFSGTRQRSVEGDSLVVEREFND